MTYSTLGVLSFSVSVVIEIESCDENFGLGPVSVTGNLGTYVVREENLGKLSTDIQDYLKKVRGKVGCDMIQHRQAQRPMV